MGFKSKVHNLSGLEGVYDVKINSAEPSARKQRWAKPGQPVKADSQQYDDARARAKEYGAVFSDTLPTGFFDYD